MRRVAVTGMGVISPIGNTLDEYWKSLRDGKCGIDFITRFDVSDYKVKVAAEGKGFDPLEYLAKSEVRKNDLYTQYAVAAAEQAVEDSGILDKIDPERFGVYIGSGIGGITTFVSECAKMEKSGPRRVSPFFIPMIISNIAAGAVSIRYKAMGPTLPCVTACATSTNTLGEAFRAIKHGYADAIIAGGSEAAICPIGVAGFTNCMALSTRNDPAAACVPFDKRRDGFVMGEGAAMLILEEYEHAKARGAKIYGEICGYGNSSDAYHITAPDPEAAGITRAMKLAIEEAGIEPDEHTYVNAHGTSTPLNDKSETVAFKNVFGEAARKVAVSSTKSMTGHLLGGAGGIESVFTVLALKNQVSPPTINIFNQDPECDLDYCANVAREMPIRYAMKNSFGFGGTNGSLIFGQV